MLENHVRDLSQMALDKLFDAANSMEGDSAEREAMMMSVLTTVATTVIITVAEMHTDDERDLQSLTNGLYGALVRSIGEGIGFRIGTMGEAVRRDQLS